MKIFIKTLTNEIWTIDIKQTATIYELKLKVQQKTGCPLDEQRLIYLGVQLCDTEVIYKMKPRIVQGATVHLVLRLRGGKPVIMLYSPYKDLPLSIGSVQLKLCQDCKLDTTYPETKMDANSRIFEWKDLMVTNNTITQNKKEYPYLFYDTLVQDPSVFGPTFVDPFFVPSDSLVSFLEGALERLGLNRREATDFITYWIHEMKVKEFCYVAFVSQKRYDEIAELKIISNVIPDQIIRVFMVFHPVGSNLGITYPKKTLDNWDIPVVERQGEGKFVVVEWGGCNLSK